MLTNPPIAFNQEKALVGAFSGIVQPGVEPMEHYTALVLVGALRGPVVLLAEPALHHTLDPLQLVQRRLLLLLFSFIFVSHEVHPNLLGNHRGLENKLFE